jgi:hypothetical protein
VSKIKIAFGLLLGRGVGYVLQNNYVAAIIPREISAKFENHVFLHMMLQECKYGLPEVFVREWGANML